MKISKVRFAHALDLPGPRHATESASTDNPQRYVIDFDEQRRVFSFRAQNDPVIRYVPAEHVLWFEAVQAVAEAKPNQR